VKEFDFVKLTLGLAGALIVGLSVAAFVLTSNTRAMERDITNIERICKDVGLKAKDIRLLEEEKNNDKMQDTTAAGIHTYFQKQAQNSHFQANEDYTLKAKDPDENKQRGYKDQQFLIEFKNRPKTREQIMKFIYHCETQSRKVKLQKAKITLVEDQALDDLWKADSLTFVRRDPLKGPNTN